MSHKLLICGVPGTGKTSIGDYLMSNLGYLHVDIEKGMVPPDLDALHVNIVVTWGFAPDDSQSLSYIQYLRLNGFKLIWFDGNRVASRNAFIARSTVAIEAYNYQMAKIDGSNIINKLNPVIINPFQPNGEFKLQEQIIEELLDVQK